MKSATSSIKFFRTLSSNSSEHYHQILLKSLQSAIFTLSIPLLSLFLPIEMTDINAP
jgi:hypothetical protein